ncbi:MAG: dihydroorotase [Planctomycetota bacterium]
MIRNRILFRGADVVLPGDGLRSASGTVATRNVLIGNGVILNVDASEHEACDRVVDAQGRTLLPGIIDDQVHFREPGLTHKEDLHHASMACASGGVTCYLEMPNTIPNAISRQAVGDKEAIAKAKSHVDFGFYIGATPDNVDELAAASNLPGIKIFIGSSTGDLLVDQQDALERIFAETKLPICAHCEDETTVRSNRQRIGLDVMLRDHSRIRDASAAMIATQRAIDLANRHQHRFHVLHVSTAAELKPIAEAIRAADHTSMITAEVCPHHLWFHVEDYDRLGSRIQMNPSIKTAADNAGLWKGLHDDTIQVIATDHAPHTLDEKSQPYPQSPSGLPAVENSLALLLDRVVAGDVTLPQVAHWMADAPARVWGITGKGRIAEGYDADLSLVDLKQTRTIRDSEQVTKSRWSPWHGTSLTGWPIETYLRGDLIWSAERGLNASGMTHVDRPAGRKPSFDHSRGGFWLTADGIGCADG